MHTQTLTDFFVVPLLGTINDAPARSILPAGMGSCDNNKCVVCVLTFLTRGLHVPCKTMDRQTGLPLCSYSSEGYHPLV